MSAPRVSVLVAVHNEERFLAAAIDSILGQTFADFELIVVDDASTDRSREIAASIRDARVRVIPNERNLGLMRSLNRGLSFCRGELVARLDGNDLAFPTRLAKQVAFLDAHREVGILGTQAVAIDVRGRRIRRASWWSAGWQRPAAGVALDWYRAFDTPFFHSSVMFRRALIERIGGYDERYVLAEDAELWARAGDHMQLANLDEALIAYRLDPTSITGDSSRPQYAVYAELKTPVIHHLWRTIFEWPDVPLRWARLWVEANMHGPAIATDDVPELIAALDACAERFFALHPEAQTMRAIAKHRASMSGRLIAPARLRTKLALSARMLRCDAPSALRFAPRAALSFVR